jgi:hypothetical protein
MDMKIRQIHIENFRALKDVYLGLSSFNCIIGANNTGKSSVLHALQAFLEGKKLKDTDFFDKGRPIKITATLEILASDLDTMASGEHRERIAKEINDGELKVTCTFKPGETVRYTLTKMAPKEEKWSEDALGVVIKGLKDAELRDAVVRAYPELEPAIKALPSPPKTQTAIKDVFAQHIAKLPADSLEERDDIPLPTGLDASLKAIFPEVIYVPAIHEVSEDVKTGDGATFGKIIGFLLHTIEPQIGHFKAELEKLERLLNVRMLEDGTKEDGRLDKVKELESAIEGYFQESFPTIKVRLKIPPPDPKRILQAGRIEVHDGALWGELDTKGDGLKRAAVFALLRAYTELSKKPDWNPKAGQNKHILLFEEPELFLYPTAQKILFEAVHTVSQSIQVVVTTHSPLFFSAARTNGFSKLVKVYPTGETPYSHITSIDFEKEIDAKTQFQVLCYENNNVAFFADKVVFVEGDTDITALQHIAGILKPEWDFEEGQVRLVKVSGKGNYARFVDFFKKFGMETLIITDLDCLIDGFDKLPLVPSSPLYTMRSKLLSEVDKLATAIDVNPDDVKETWKERGQALRTVIEKMKARQDLNALDEQLLTELDCMLGRYRTRVKVLQTRAEVKSAKCALLKELRKEGIMILNKGCIDDYYPEGLQLKDKTKSAEKFRATIKTRAEVVSLAENVPDECGVDRNEFEAIFDRIFRTKSSMGESGNAPSRPLVDSMPQGGPT